MKCEEKFETNVPYNQLNRCLERDMKVPNKMKRKVALK